MAPITFYEVFMVLEKQDLYHNVFQMDSFCKDDQMCDRQLPPTHACIVAGLVEEPEIALFTTAIGLERKLAPFVSSVHCLAHCTNPCISHSNQICIQFLQYSGRHAMGFSYPLHVP